MECTLKQSMQAKKKKKKQKKHITETVGTFEKQGRNQNTTHPQSILRLHQNVKVEGSDENTKRGRDEQTMLLPVGVCDAVNKGFLLRGGGGEEPRGSIFLLLISVSFYVIKR